ncbi:hypothetical protein CHUAL_006455 [Chamberlinius hualienensis]
MLSKWVLTCFLVFYSCFLSNLEVNGAVRRQSSSGTLQSSSSTISGTVTRGDCNAEDCRNDVGSGSSSTSSTLKWRMPLANLGNKSYYLGIFFKANWYRSYQFCRYHGLHLVSIESQEENQRLEDYIKTEGLMAEHFWTSGTDQSEEGSFFWMGTGRPLTYTNWNAGEPNNFKYENGESERCVELWNRDAKGLRWNDSPCSFETYFICEKIEDW